MMLSPPAFWSQDGASPLARLLSPAGRIYGAIVARRIEAARPARAAVPVVCIGNVTLGGVGKTPFAALLANLLTRHGVLAHILTRGYGGTEKGPVFVSPEATFRQVGDEALLLARHAPVWVASDRPAGAAEAARNGADAILMDDGHQNPSLHKDFSFALIDAETGFGNGRIFPAGPLRESPEASLARADAAVFVTRGSGEAAPADLRRRVPAALPKFTAWLEPDSSALDRDKAVFAFAGIARPERFFDMLRRQGFALEGTRAFPDHHPFAESDMQDLLKRAAEHGAQLVTTEKDAVRLPAEMRAQIRTLPVTMRVSDEAQLLSLLAPALGRPL
ncbi:tetraacyldisaccharide 4'-kinase [Parvularcula oceani]|uniref:tetraacyldisaccharide 4'-kinase n=1 Tax=Parvularcula oceani TaxID=1247963 RepID=UPI000AAA79D4|nr:tetraacyldisaccharide 4'-kinase [Parvularcula oceani]